ncbi:MAG TPA: DUF4743 domain-containing protein [Acetobacteraceae bacterium]
MQQDISGFLRHVNNCRNVVLPDGRKRFWLGDQPVGWVRAELTATLARFPRVASGADGVRLEDPPALPAMAQALSQQGVFRWRNEQFDVRAEPDGPALAVIDRGALPVFGIEAVGAHVNGLVEDRDGLRLWVGRRSADRPLDPGKLDHLVAGGVPAGLTPAATLRKEAKEEAGVAPELAGTAVHAGTIRYVMERPEGLRRDLLHCYDLVLPNGVQPVPGDGEIEWFQLWPLQRVVDTVRDTDAFKFNVNLVLIDLFLRRGVFAQEAAAALRAALTDMPAFAGGG